MTTRTFFLVMMMTRWILSPFLVLGAGTSPASVTFLALAPPRVFLDAGTTTSGTTDGSADSDGTS